MLFDRQYSLCQNRYFVRSWLRPCDPFDLIHELRVSVLNADPDFTLIHCRQTPPKRGFGGSAALTGEADRRFLRNVRANVARSVRTQSVSLWICAETAKGCCSRDL
jgi:hypothetical protein